MARDEAIRRISDWMRFWAPEVKKRAERGEALFGECRDAYKAVCRLSDDEDAIEHCLAKMKECGIELDKAPPGAYDYLAHIGTYVP